MGRGVEVAPAGTAQTAQTPQTAEVAAIAAPTPAARSRLDEIWELTASRKTGTFRLLPHKLNYLLPVHATSRVNDFPRSPAPDHATIVGQQLDNVESKFQLSLKVKALQNLFGDNGDVWLAFTQQSSWQTFSGELSSPFRESNYEPEALLALRTDVDALGWRWRLLNLGAVHQSNGQALPRSRSWNRVYAEFGLERGNFVLQARPWWRIREDAATDDNPDIDDYLGSGDLRLTYARAGHIVSALGRYSFSGKRGALQLEWAFPISQALKGYVQASSGYGESLIDYNHAQSTFGIGILLLPWD